MNAVPLSGHVPKLGGGGGVGSLYTHAASSDWAYIAQQRSRLPSADPHVSNYPRRPLCGCGGGGAESKGRQKRLQRSRNCVVRGRGGGRKMGGWVFLSPSTSRAALD